MLKAAGLLHLQPLAREAHQARALEVGEAPFDLQFLYRGGGCRRDGGLEVMLQR